MKRKAKSLRSNHLIQTLFSLQGNPKACLWIEWMWGIPYNLYYPYVALYMTRIGFSLTQIGALTSVTMASQMICAFLSGVLADKLGRRRCTVIFDTLSWSVPELIWMLTRDYRGFLLAAVLNGMWRITDNSWYLLMVEDTTKDKAIALSSIAQIMGLVAAFFTPLSKFAVDSFGLEITMRVFYGIAFVLMTAKFWLLYAWSTETANGVQRMEEAKGKSIFSMLGECREIYKGILREPRMRLTLGVLSIYMLITTLNSNYWGLYLRDALGIYEGDVSLFATLKSVVELICIFWFVPKIRYTSIKAPMLISLGVFAISQALLLVARAGTGAVSMLIISTMLEAGGISMLSPMYSSLVFFHAEEKDRARVLGMINGTIALLVAVFPVIIGRMAQVSLKIPFGVNLVLFALLAVISAKVAGYEVEDKA